QFVTGRGIYDRYKKNPEKIKNKKVWSEVENWMGVTIVNSSIFWSPDIVVVGGAVGLNKNISADRINKRIKEVFSLMPKIPLVKKAELGQLSGLYGALAMAKQNRR
ncbi:MAG TPA: ROK family protein, partial [Candidatus Binatia bacterium]|nr:ROK family protein [Candidatus Binatia bacterium]